MKISARSLLSLALAAWLGLAGCNGSAPKGKPQTDTPTSGQISIGVDESFAPIVRSTIQTYEEVYQGTKITPSYVSEATAYKAMLEDKLRMVVGSRKLNAEERAYFAKLRITPTEVEYAKDAVALIVHPTSTDTLLTLDQAKGLLSGQTAKWAGSKQAVVTVVDRLTSSNTLYTCQKLGLPKLSGQVFETGSNQAVVDYVAKTPGALGLVGLGFIAGGGGSFSRGIRVVALSEAAFAQDSNSYQPYQAYLQLKKYPLIRPVYLVSREARTGLATGFISWAVSEKGQRIVLKAGLLPVTMPVRIVSINKGGSVAE